MELSFYELLDEKINFERRKIFAEIGHDITQYEERIRKQRDTIRELKDDIRIYHWALGRCKHELLELRPVAHAQGIYCTPYLVEEPTFTEN